MKISYKTNANLTDKGNFVVIVDNNPNWNKIKISRGAKSYLKDKWKKTSTTETYYSSDQNVVMVAKGKKPGHNSTESYRQAGVNAEQILNSTGSSRVTIANYSSTSKAGLLVAEGMGLATYQFLKYKTGKVSGKKKLKSIYVMDGSCSKEDVSELSNLVVATFTARDLVNEPLSYLTASQYSEDIKALGKEAGFKVQVFNKKKIEELKMGGVLAVNRGSLDPPTFNIMEWKPEGAVNSKPVVLVGKGIVYDTGGLSLKPTPNSMDIMKCDMAGSAAVVGAMQAIATNNLPLHVVGLVPATDNRPGVNAYVPGDVITMYNGMTVEVLNTDAEGRLVLADALKYAQQYDPELVIDLATLTGAAMRAIGPHGVVAMGNMERKEMEDLKAAGDEVHERIAEMPFWEDYGELMKSDLADLKNIGGAIAGAITAGKFLEHFTDYPWMHLDIAGPAWRKTSDGYRLKNGTGVGVRLLYQFLKGRVSQADA